MEDKKHELPDPASPIPPDAPGEAGSQKANNIPDGFALAYSSEAGIFRTKIMAGAATTLLAYGIATGNGAALVAGMAAAAVAYYFFPLIEPRPRFGASEYGIFIEGLGIIGWRSVRDIGQLTFAVRSIGNEHLLIELAEPLDTALVADWRRLPVWRALMFLPWKRDGEHRILIRLEPFGGSPEAIFTRLRSMWQFFRGPIWRRMEADRLDD